MSRISRLRALAAATLVATAVITVGAPSPAAAASPPPVSSATPTTSTTPADRVIEIARAERGRPWVFGAEGPTAFDCSGLVIYAFRRAGVLDRIGGGHYRGGSAMYQWARRHQLTGATGHRGDVVVYGGGSHVGIYLGKGMAISTLVSGVRIHGVRALTTSFTTFIHTGLSSATAAGARAATPTAAKTPAKAKATTGPRRTVVVAALNLRAGPGRTTAARGVLHRGTRLAVVRSAKDGAGRTWYRVTIGGRSGWVAGWLTRAAG